MELQEYIKSRLLTLPKELMAIDKHGMMLSAKGMELSKKEGRTAEEDDELRIIHAEMSICKHTFEGLIHNLVELSTLAKIAKIEETDEVKEAFEKEKQLKELIKPYFIIEAGEVRGVDQNIKNTMIEYLNEKKKQK